jgi:hypothetical protein
MAGNGTGAANRFEAGAASASRAASAGAAAGAAGHLAAADRFADDLFDELLPPSLDWRHLVRSYPRAAVAVAAAAGFWVARKKSGLILAAVTSYVAAQFGDAISDLGDGGSARTEPGQGH